MGKLQLIFNYDLSNKFYLSCGVGIYKERISINWHKLFLPEDGQLGGFNPSVFSENLEPTFFSPLSVGYKFGNERKCKVTVEAGLMASLSGGNFGNSFAHGSQYFGHSYEEGDSTYRESWYSYYTYKKPIAINFLFKLGMSFTSKRESVLDIHFLVSKGLVKTIIGHLEYYKKVPSYISSLQFPNTNPIPDETYNFFNRGAQYGFGISYMINWNELKKNRRLEKEYEIKKEN